MVTIVTFSCYVLKYFEAIKLSYLFKKSLIASITYIEDGYVWILRSTEIYSTLFSFLNFLHYLNLGLQVHGIKM